MQHKDLFYIGIRHASFLRDWFITRFTAWSCFSSSVTCGACLLRSLPGRLLCCLPGHLLHYLFRHFFHFPCSSAFFALPLFAFAVVLSWLSFYLIPFSSALSLVQPAVFGIPFPQVGPNTLHWSGGVNVVKF